MSGCCSPSNGKDGAACEARDLTRQRWSQFLWLTSLAAFVAGCVFPAGRAWLWSGGLMVAGALCVANASRCGRLHCYLTGPIFLAGGVVSALRGFGVLDWSWQTIGNAVGISALAAFLLECIGGRYVHR